VAATDELAAELHMKVERAKFKVQAVEDSIFLRLDPTKGVAVRQAEARSSVEYITAMDEYFIALQAHESLKNERTRKYAVIECWRSWSSARTKGIL
jgi:hypothetical protein